MKSSQKKGNKMKRTYAFLVSFFIVISSTYFLYAQENCNFGSYLVGTYNIKDGSTIIQVVNPTASPLSIYVAFLNDREDFIYCFIDKLSPNDLLEIDVKSVLSPYLKLAVYTGLGVVKIVSFRGERPELRAVVPGIVGYQQKYKRISRNLVMTSESNLSAIPNEILEKEIDLILSNCKKIVNQ